MLHTCSVTATYSSFWVHCSDVCVQATLLLQPLSTQWTDDVNSFDVHLLVTVQMSLSGKCLCAAVTGKSFACVELQVVFPITLVGELFPANFAGETRCFVLLRMGMETAGRGEVFATVLTNKLLKLGGSMKRTLNGSHFGGHTHCAGLPFPTATMTTFGFSGLVDLFMGV